MIVKHFGYNSLQNFHLFAYPTTKTTTLPPPPPQSYYYFYPTATSAMYTNPAYAHSGASNTNANPAAASSAFPDYSAYMPYTSTSYNDHNIMNAYYGGAYPSQSTTYRSYPQPETSSMVYRRSRTAPSRAAPSRTYKTTYTKRNRAYTTDPYIFDPREYRSYSGPWKDTRNWPMYRKRKEPPGRIRTYQESEFGGSPVDRQAHFYQQLYRDMQPTVLRRIRPYYAPSYMTYPPSIMKASRPQEKYDHRYSTVMRIVVKAIELLLGAAIIGLILAPLRDTSFYAFVKMTETEWQGLVLGIATTFSILCLIMLLSVCIGYRYPLWRRIDFLISLIGSVGYLIAGAVETYYAACYPPYGEKIGIVCHRLEWIIASALIFINFIVYVVDSVLSFRIGISL